MSFVSDPTQAWLAGLSLATPQTSIGEHLGYPFALTISGEGNERLYLFQVRHLNEHVPVLAEIAKFSPELTALRERGAINIDVESKIAWLTLYPGGDWTQEARLIDLFEKFLCALGDAGILAGDGCHHCGQVTATRLVHDGGRVGKLCDACLARRFDDELAARELNPANLPRIFAAGAGGVLAGAIGWALLNWIGSMVAEWREFGLLFIARFVQIILVVAGALVAAGPAGWLLRRIPSRGDRLASVFGLLFTVFALIGGEWLHGAWIAWHHGGGIHSAWFEAGRWWREAAPMFLLMKVCTIITSLAVGWELSRPKPLRLKL